MYGCFILTGKEQRSQSVCRLLVSAAESVSVDVHGGADLGMTQPGGNRLHVDIVYDHESRVSMAQAMERDLRKLILMIFVVPADDFLILCSVSRHPASPHCPG